MRENIGIGYLIELFDNKVEKISIVEPLVGLYIPKDVKKLSHLNRAPEIGDVVEARDHNHYLLIDVIHREDSEEAQEVLPHITNIIHTKDQLKDYIVEVVGDNESTFDRLVDEYMESSAN
ncbi:hypothetical protein [Vagococcus bubulae]|uniref:Uncharacterized protein n=1 Tax=Vagococcus bubulae TaxID=1977868 RepID=A0A429ZHS2_9ENTE|nr:hypothetical protein [Vagococcus bubulae]RST93134.1 hypothetical protein CBF36_07935 [Vagococcus bubulae]